MGGSTRQCQVVPPHVLLETAAYLLAAMAGVFLSRAVVRYWPMDDRFIAVAQVVIRHLLAAAVLIILAGLVEGLISSWLASVWFRPMPVVS